MSQEEQREAFADVLSTTLGRVIDFLKFAEAKNAALLTFASAWALASITLLNSQHSPSGVVGDAFRIALVIFAVASVVAVWSLLPKLRLPLFHRDPVQEKNFIYFGDIADLDALAYETRVLERYMPSGGDGVTDKYLHDLSVQISVNSKIAKRKYATFHLGVRLILVAMAVLALAAASAAMHRWSGGALAWA